MSIANIAAGTFWILITEGLLSGFFVLPVLIPFIGIPIVCVWFFIIFLSVREFRKNGTKPPLEYFYFAIPILLSLIGIALLGVLYWNTGYNGVATSTAASNATTVLGAVNLLLVIYGVVRAKSWRMTVLALGIFFLFWTLGTLFISGMAISGTWL